MKFNIRFSLKMRERNASQNGKNGEICQKTGNGIALENFSKLLAFIYFYGLSFHDTFVRIFYDLRTRNTGGKRLKRISSSLCHFPTGQTQEVFSSLE